MKYMINIHSYASTFIFFTYLNGPDLSFFRSILGPVEYGQTNKNLEACFSPGNLTSLTVWRHTVFCDAMAMAIAGSRDDPEKKSGNLEWNDKELKVTWNWSFFLLMHGAKWQGRAGKSKSNSMCDCANVRKCVLLSQFEGFEMLQQEQVARSSLAGLAFLCWIWIGHSWN